MSSMYRTSRKESGFSLVELLMVVAILLVVAALAAPTMVNVIANVRLRGSMSSLAGIFQDCRSFSIKQNRLISTHFTTMANGPVAYLKNATVSSPSLATTDQQVQLGAPVSKITNLTGVTGAPTGLDSTTLGFTPLTSDPSFNPRGLPCSYDTTTGLCTANVGFVYYFTDTRVMGANGWAAVTISPAGRVKIWMWNGSAWGS